MLALIGALAFAAPPPSQLPSTELPGLERQIRWGMAAEEVAAAVRGFAWIGGQPEANHGMAAGTAVVAGKPATLVFQFGRNHLAVVMVVFDLAAGDDGRKQFAELSRVLHKNLGRPATAASKQPARPDGKSSISSKETWRVRGSEVTHVVGSADGRPQHVLHLSDARRPDYGDPSPNYAFH